MRTQLLLACLCGLLVACEGKTGPTGPQGPQGPPGMTGPEGPAYVLTADDVLGTWEGEKRIEDGSGTGFIPDGVRHITFAGDGTYTSDIFTDGASDLSGSWIVVGSSIVVTSPPIPTGVNTNLFQLEDVVVTADSLRFVLDVRPVTNGFLVGESTAYLLAKK